MRSNFYRSLTAMGLTLGLAVSAHAASLEQIKKDGYIRGASANEVPYSYMDESGAAKGIGPDVAAAVLKSMGVKEVDWTVTPFGSLIPGLKAKRFDFVAAEQNILPERCKQVQFTTPNSSYGEGLLVPKGNPKKLHSYEDIKKDPSLKVAIVSGADQLDFFHGLGIPESQIVMIQANADALSTIQTGRADAYAATELTVAKLVQGSTNVEHAEPFTDPVINGKSVRSYGGFDFRPEDKDLYKAFNTALEAFKKTDDYKKILMSYGLSAESVEAARTKSTDDLCAGK
ncbi:amino acid ABC transporter substrate-binding protein (PAAT family) [Rhizobium sp. ERR 922]|uniref:Ectoine/hydroxyectoine ABC transporter substrate-binding protein EhuB n=1 Tax=Rhizobium dioscoreae TaxID=2653122 RepID=A0ABQ0Z7A2_9HYPH|nr:MULTISPECIES: ectoine/hydroxyectoine ABC transporter substrate-binding protein EhuB [Rhizobium]MCZ3374957.1 ectoine/hydroxyectoine ABC transporter substrate-binding protein EhuB [Rhizobium sp. AG207R]TWB53584.1 amino acid ABC transporter substrate-binding protein (PAAT family) [Rhizobium sp. ERR 922]TWB95452.1 amino acid ABC transporter substrate-binding protein (PAAT family) [Rhizobium sp. ERR 942]GES41130.1 ectoine/hydroxyectoine ABC transporter substrate-binding protein EhuB [Rhizobium di